MKTVEDFIQILTLMAQEVFATKSFAPHVEQACANISILDVETMVNNVLDNQAFGEKASSRQLTVFVGPKLADIRKCTNAPVFEDLFHNRTSAEYADCWSEFSQWSMPTSEVICKTTDALLAAPDHAMIKKIGRSIRLSDFGEIIQTQFSKEEVFNLFRSGCW